MRVRLTEIALLIDDVHHPVGAVVTEDQVPAALLAERLAAGSAELVLDEGDVRPVVGQALQLLDVHCQAVFDQVVAVLDLVEGGNLAELKAVELAIEAMGARFEAMPVFARLQDFEDRLREGQALAAFSAPGLNHTDATVQTGGDDGKPAAAPAVVVVAPTTAAQQSTPKRKAPAAGKAPAAKKAEPAEGAAR